MTQIPYWSDSQYGAMNRAAHWLFSEVGEGGVFRKLQLREAVPDREQVDRRARGLRRYGWVIRNYRDPDTLAADQHLVETIGDHIWEQGYRNERAEMVSLAMRRAVFDRDGNRCVVCGIGAGEDYPDLPSDRARLTLGHLVPTGRQSRNIPDNWRTECSKCNEPARHLTGSPVDLGLVKAQVRELSRAERASLAEWAGVGRCASTRLEGIWIRYRQLPADQRDEVRAA